MIKNVFLDLDDTILDFQRGERQAIKRTFEAIGVPSDPETIERYIDINLSGWRALERGEMSREQVLYGRFERLFAKLGITGSGEQTQKLYQGLLAEEHDFITGGKELLEALNESGKYRLYLATNGIPEVQHPRIKGSGIERYFSRIFISEEIGYPKPRREYFEACFAAIEGFKESETIIVGDSLTSDIQGGINAGILTCHFNPKNNPYTDIRPDFKINNLSELPSLLDSIE